MEYATLKNGLRMPLLGFGTYKISEAAECRQSVSWALSAGYRLFDTAQFYGNEAAVGEAVAVSGMPRSELFLITKLWIHSYEPEQARAALRQSLKNLRTEYLDLVLLHWPFGNTYAAWRVLEEFYDAGVFKAIGVSNFTPAQLVDLLQFNRVAPMLNQVEANLWCQRQDEWPWHRKYGVMMQAYAPLGRKRPPELFTEAPLTTVARKYGKSVRQVMLRYLMQRGVAVIPKSTHEERIRENIAVFDFMLGADDMEALRKLDRNEPLIGMPQDPARAEELFRR